MKKLVMLAIGATMITGAVNAQAPNRPEFSKEEKAKFKAKEEEEQNAAFTQAGLSPDQQAQAKQAMDDARQKGKDLKNDASLTPDQKDAKKEEINAAKNEKLKQIMGADKFKVYNDIRKKQKEARRGMDNGVPPPPPPPPSDAK